jgi:hypothetical protein
MLTRFYLNWGQNYGDICTALKMEEVTIPTKSKGTELFNRFSWLSKLHTRGILVWYLLLDFRCMLWFLDLAQNVIPLFLLSAQYYKL